MLVHCAHFSPQENVPLTTMERPQTSCHKFAEKTHPCCWISFIVLIIFGFLSAFFYLNKTTDWRVIWYILFIAGCIGCFGIAAVLYLKDFGKELHVEFQGAIMGQINKIDRPLPAIRRDSNVKQLQLMRSPNQPSQSRKFSTYSMVKRSTLDNNSEEDLRRIESEKLCETAMA